MRSLARVVQLNEGKTQLRAFGALAAALHAYPAPVQATILDRAEALAASDAILDALIRRVLPHLMRVAFTRELVGIESDLDSLRLDCLAEQRRRAARPARPEAVVAGQVRA